MRLVERKLARIVTRSFYILHKNALIKLHLNIVRSMPIGCKRGRSRMRSYISSAFKSMYLYTYVYIHIYIYACARTHIYFLRSRYTKNRCIRAEDGRISRKEFTSMHLACVPVSQSGQTTLPNSREEIYFSSGLLFSSSPPSLSPPSPPLFLLVVQSGPKGIENIICDRYISGEEADSLRVTRIHTFYRRRT